MVGQKALGFAFNPPCLAFELMFGSAWVLSNAERL